MDFNKINNMKKNMIEFKKQNTNLETEKRKRLNIHLFANAETNKTDENKLMEALTQKEGAFNNQQEFLETQLESLKTEMSSFQEIQNNQIENSFKFFS